MREFSFVNDSDFTPPDLVISINGELFQLNSEVSSLDLVDFIAAAVQGGSRSIGALNSFLKQTLDLPSEDGEDSQWERFSELLRKNTASIGITELTELANGIVREYTGRPTSPSSDGP